MDKVRNRKEVAVLMGKLVYPAGVMDISMRKNRKGGAHSVMTIVDKKMITLMLPPL